MVQVQACQNDMRVPRGAGLSCTSPQASREEIGQMICVLIDDAIVGDASRIEATLAQIAPTSKPEFELMAKVIVSKALDEPQHCKACISLASALQILLPALPSRRQGKKGESFKHVLLDEFQSEFDAACIEPVTPIEEELQTQQEKAVALVAQRNQHEMRIHAIGYLAGHLLCHGLLGKGVVNQMMNELVEMGQAEVANKLLWFINTVSKNVEHRHHLGTVLEVADDCGGANSESIND